MKNKILLYILLGVSLCVTGLVICDTFALFERDAYGLVELETGKWRIKLNNINITNGYTQNVVINNFNYNENSHVADGYIAPGMSGYVDIELDPTGTDTAISYNIDFDLDELDNLAENISVTIENITDGEEDNNETASSYSGIISLDDIEEEKKITLRINVTWDDLEDYDESDTEFGTTQNSFIAVPLTISLMQYLGE